MSGTLLIVIKFLKSHWQTISVALVAGLIVLGVSVLWGRLYVAQGNVQKLTGTIELMEQRELGFQKALGLCAEDNEAWESLYSELLQRSMMLANDQAEYERRLAEALEAAAEVPEPAPDLEAIGRAESCEAAVDELVAAFGWTS